MSHLQYKTYGGHGENAKKAYNMSQVVRVPPGETITISGQGGWDRSNSELPKDVADEIAQAFENVNFTLIDGGGKGMSQVYKLVIYYVSLSPEANEAGRKEMLKWFPDHQPILTVLGVEKLARADMRVEIEAWAHVA